MNLKGKITNDPCWFVCSWSGSWRCVRRRAVSCRSTLTRCCSRSQTTAPTSWSRWSTRWRSRANAAVAADASDLHASLFSARLTAVKAGRDERLHFLARQLLPLPLPPSSLHPALQLLLFSSCSFYQP